MDSSIPLFKVRGISIRMHITFPLILVWAALQFGWLTGHGWRGAGFGVLVTLLLFAIVVLHELAHSLVAMRFGVIVKNIVLLPIGGVSQIERMPEEPRQEFAIAVAGPAVNFALAAVLYGVALALGQNVGLREMSLALSGMGSLGLKTILPYLLVSNLFLGIFNLLPAFPMDGGRVLRALLATKLEYGRATAIAVTIGHSLAWLLGLWGFLSGGFFLILIAVFVYVGAGQEGQLVQVRRVLGDMKVRQAYSGQARALSPHDKLQDAVQLTLHSFQSDFPVCDGEQLVGLLTQTRLVEALHRLPVETPVSEVMYREFDTVSPEEGLFALQQRLAQSKLDAVPVVEGGKFLGLITSRDIGEAYVLISSQSGRKEAGAKGLPEARQAGKMP